jgi:D,D-heptose 1,7-bisphosphate phosphatase
MKAVFIDKDGTLIENQPYNVDLSLIRFTAGAVAGLRLLREAGYQLILVSNQSGVARGFFDCPAVDHVNAYLQGLLEENGVAFAGFYYCPHHPEGVVSKYTEDCYCRKPRPGLLLQAAYELGLNLSASYMIGDILDDVEAGHAAGCRSILLDRGSETEWLMSPLRKPDFTATTLLEAARYIVAREEPVRAIAGGLHRE